MVVEITPEMRAGLTNVTGRAVQVGGGAGMLISAALTEVGQTIIERASPQLAIRVGELLGRMPGIVNFQDNIAVPFGFGGAALIAVGALIREEIRR